MRRVPEMTSLSQSEIISEAYTRNLNNSITKKQTALFLTLSRVSAARVSMHGMNPKPAMRQLTSELNKTDLSVLQSVRCQGSIHDVFDMHHDYPLRDNRPRCDLPDP